MKRLASFLLLLAAAVQGLGQGNLAPNPSFEAYASCPNGNSQIFLSLGWQSHLNSEEYYNACSPLYSVPQNPFGYQCAVTGLGYSGLYSFNPLGASQESFGIPLLNPMQIGQKYYVSMKTVLAEWSGSASNKLGILFSTVHFNDVNPPPISNFAHIYSNSIISDTTAWTTITGSFIADSAYQYISIGTFFDDFNIDTLVFNSVKDGTTYYFIDDICVSTDSITCIDITAQVIDFNADTTNIIQGNTINYSINSGINYDFYNWQFDGGIPSSSTDNNPTAISYNTPGIYSVTLIASDSNGCADTIIKKNYTMVDSATAINDEFFRQFVKIYPNPVRDKLFLEINDNVTKVTVYDMLGKIVYWTNKKVDKIEFKDKPAGIYVLNLETEKYYTNHKFIHLH